MKKAIFLLFTPCILFLNACKEKPSKTETTVIDMYYVNNEGIGKKAGQVQAQNTKDGLLLNINLNGVPQGEHGFHIHETASCEPLMQDGKPVAALGAGGHYDPYKKHAHLGPYGDGHKGDLPFLTAGKNGEIKTSVTMSGLTINDLKGRSLMLHAGADNYSDTPKPLGGGGARIICGLVAGENK